MVTNAIKKWGVRLFVTTLIFLIEVFRIPN